MKRQRLSKRNRKTVAADIGRIILLLHAHKVCDDLCDTGIKRLQWWRTVGAKFKSAADAFATWDEADVRAWLEWRGVDYNFDNAKEDHKSSALTNISYLERNLQRLKLNVRGLAAIKKRVQAFDTGRMDTLIKAAVKAIPSARDIQ